MHLHIFNNIMNIIIYANNVKLVSNTIELHVLIYVHTYICTYIYMYIHIYVFMYSQLDYNLIMFLKINPDSPLSCPIYLFI